MHKLATILILALVIPASALGQAADPQAKAAQILKQARAAIGDESKLKAVQSLTAVGNQRITFNGRQLESEVEVDLLMPDKVLRTTTSERGTNLLALNGDQLWVDFIPAMGAAGGGPGGGPRFAGMRPGDGNANSPMAKYFQQQQRRELLQLVLGWLLAPPSGSEWQFSYLGDAQGPNGKVEVLDGKTADGIVTRLYIDQQTHHLVGLSYKAKQLRRAFGGRGPGGPGGPGGQAGQGGQGGNREGAPRANREGGGPGQPPASDEDRERRRREIMENFEKAPESDYRWAFDDYKGVGGLNLPHRLTKIEDGTPNEEWEITKFKINPKLNPEKFVKKERAPEKPQ